MINELVTASVGIKNAGISSTNWHPKFKELPKGKKECPCLRVWLGLDGRVVDVEIMQFEQVATLRKYEPNNGEALPGFNVLPLFRITKSDEEIKQSKSLKSGWLQQVFDSNEDDLRSFDFWSKTRVKAGNCFDRVLKDILNQCKDSLIDGETLSIFLNAIDAIDIDQFQADYCSIVLDKVKSGKFPDSLLCYFLTESKKQKEDSDSKAQLPLVSVFLDVKDYKDYPVAHSKTMSRFNELLMQSKAKENEALESCDNGDLPLFDKTVEKVVDAYGLDVREISEKFPSVSVPSFGSVILRSQVKTIPAQIRYNLCESDTFPVGSETRKSVKAALEWLSNKEMEGFTYGRSGDQELLFAYPRVLPKSKPQMIKMMGAQADQLLRAKRFKELSESVISELRGLGSGVDDAELEIFSLRKMDKARTKVVYYRNVSVESLEVASKAWDDGCKNIPAVSGRVWSDEKNPETKKSFPVGLESRTVFPVRLYSFLNDVSKLDGASAGKLKTFEPASGLRLLLDDSSELLAKNMLKAFMQNANGYFLTLCRNVGRNEVSKLQNADYYIGILGLLLSKLGNHKETYMGESAFLLGRFLRIGDEVHRLYCEVVRDGGIPPDLCGSGLLGSMMESPITTFNQFSMRFMPYLKWAKGGSNKGDKGGLVNYWLKQYEPIADQLKDLPIPARLKPEERAQVFLGYLASFPKSEAVAQKSNLSEPEKTQNEASEPLKK